MSNKYMKQLTADHSLCSQGVEQKEFLCSAGSDQWELPLWRAAQQELVKLNPVTSNCLTLFVTKKVLAQVCQKRWKIQKNAHHNIVMAKTKIYRQAKSPSTGD